MHVFDEAAPAVLVEIAQIGRIANAGAVAAVVVDDACIAVFSEKPHYGQIALLVFRHAVGKLHQRAGRRVGNDGGYGEGKPVVLGREGESFHF